MNDMLCCLPCALCLLILGGGGEFCFLLVRIRLNSVSLPYLSNSVSPTLTEVTDVLQIA